MPHTYDAGESWATRKPPLQIGNTWRSIQSVMPKSVIIINGPNLNLLGQREPDIYGRTTLADIERDCAVLAQQHGADMRFLQSNAEHQLIDWIHEARGTAGGIIINPGALSHTSIAILDALNAFEGPVLEVHISNIHKRETFRHHSYVSARANGVIAGFGTAGYAIALTHMIDVLLAA
jgi:3-dehydroquinate dehydratase II